MPSEGVVAFILKTPSAALRDGDSILAVVKSTDTKHGGRSQGPSSPNVKTQIALQESLLRKASLKPSDIEYVYMDVISCVLAIIDDKPVLLKLMGQVSRWLLLFFPSLVLIFYT